MNPHPRKALRIMLIASSVMCLIYYVICNEIASSYVAQKQDRPRPERILHKLKRRRKTSETVKTFEEFLDLRKCTPHLPISVYPISNGLAENEKIVEAFFSSGYATKRESGACVIIYVGDTSRVLSNNNSVVVNWQNSKSIQVGGSLRNYRSRIDIIGYSRFEFLPWIHPGRFLGGKEFLLCTFATKAEPQTFNSTMQSFSLTENEGLNKLKDCSFVFVLKSPEFETRMKATLIVGAIPIVLERDSGLLPFRELTDPEDYLLIVRDVDQIELLLPRISANREFEMRRSGRIFYDRYLRHPKGFARGVIEVLSKRLSLPLQFPLPIYSPILPEASQKFTVVVLSFKRIKTLELMVAVFQQIEEFVAKIIIVWNTVDSPLPEKQIPSKIELQFIRLKKNSLNNRFLAWHKIRTDCVLTVDDDIAVDKRNLLLGFRTWQSERDRIVSFVPRRREVDEHGNPVYSTEKKNRHEFGLTGYAFLHRVYLYEYFISMPAAFRNYVDAHRNCEDIAMNYLVAHLSRRSAISIAYGGSLNMIKNLTGLSSRTNHQQVRTECVRFFEAAYGYNPLQSSFYQAANHNIHIKPIK